MSAKLKKGLVQIYTGNGKGKTTASLGLALRASGAGLKVCVLQFIKKRPYSEIKALKKIKNIEVAQYGRGCFIRKKPSPADIKCAKQGLEKAKRVLASSKFDMLILDEANIALKLGLLTPEEIITLVKMKPRNVELILTGRSCPGRLFRYADLITDMREIKHPYNKGVKARPGIEF